METVFALLRYFYGMSLEEIENLTLYQFFMYYREVSKIRELFWAQGSKKEDLDNQDFIETSRSLGLTLPTKYRNT